MSIIFSSFLLFFLTTLTASAASSALHPDELNALREIATTLGIKRLNLSAGDPCHTGSLMIIQEEQDVLSNSAKNNSIVCDCSFNNNMTCHIKVIELKTLSLPGKLPPQLVKLRYLQKIDLCLNYLWGTIPMEWASLPYLTSVSVCANRLTGNLPPGLQYFKNLTYLSVEGNQFSGTIPDELANLTSLTTLHLASNKFTGRLPSTLARLVNLEDFRICDNDFTGVIPRFIGNWSGLRNLHLYASGLKGPIPDEVARLENLTELSISDTTGINSFPNISSNAIKNLILRNVSMSGSIPSYIWNKIDLNTLDLSFNKLTGQVEALEKAPKNTGFPAKCMCGLDPTVYTSKTKTNPGRPFFRCPTKREDHLFKWVEEAVFEEVVDVVPKVGFIEADFHNTKREIEAMKAVIFELKEEVVSTKRQLRRCKFLMKMCFGLIFLLILFSYVMIIVGNVMAKNKERVTSLSF